MNDSGFDPNKEKDPWEYGDRQTDRPEEEKNPAPQDALPPKTEEKAVPPPKEEPPKEDTAGSNPPSGKKTGRVRRDPGRRTRAHRIIPPTTLMGRRRTDMAPLMGRGIPMGRPEPEARRGPFRRMIILTGHRRTGTIP